ncbi:MAG: winged helix-turn-helix transcriptional regulator [Candidatus Lokiarchaeota archaeon]|nr:winged helix-turn-helix transcriptional regulator [Candidatus Lokiarchaeota archaeon]
MNEIKMNNTELRRKEKSLSILSNIIRLKILYLLAETEGRLNFNEIAAKLKIEKNKLSYHVALLKNNKFISNKVRSDREGRAFSFYNITNKGENAIEFIEKIQNDDEEDLKELEMI